MTLRLTALTASFLTVSAVAAYQAGTNFLSARHRQTETAILQRQAQAIAMRAENFGQADSAMIGDSILASASIDCGRSFYATVPAIRSAEMNSSAQTILALVKPSVAIVGLGTNDQRDLGKPSDLSPYAKWSGRIIWIAAPGSAETTREMQRLARKRGGEVVYTFTGPTSDGIHPDRAGRAQISRELSQICKQELARR